MDEVKANNDRELWCETPDDYYSPSIHVTDRGAIGINVGGLVIVRDVRAWHAAHASPPRDLFDAVCDIVRRIASGEECVCIPGLPHNRNCIRPAAGKAHMRVAAWRKEQEDRRD